MNWTRSICPVIFFCFIACANSGHQEEAGDKSKEPVVPANNTGIDSFEKGKVISPIPCRSDAAQSYALYIPSNNSNEGLPVIYFFDPHGNGSLPLNKYRVLADRYGFILVGSNNSRNGNDTPTSEAIWNILSGDTRSRLKINAGRVYACGFSGGAKVASYIGLNHSEVRAVIANGAGIPDINRGDGHFSFTAIAGEGDMNMTDLVGINEDLAGTKIKHRIILFDGKHEWAPVNTMDIAFAGLQFDAMNAKQIPVDSLFTRQYINESKKKIAGGLAKNNYIKAEAECELTTNLLDGLTNEVNWFREKDASLKSSQAYQKQSKARQGLLVAEQNFKAEYSQQFQSGDMNYWTKTINTLQAQARTPTAEGAMYQRLVAYLSLAFYSISNQFVTANRNQEAEYFVELYKMDDPTNSEAWYFSALLHARNKDVRAATDDLFRCVENGFADRDRLMQQPEFRIPGMDLNAILNKMNGK